VAFLRQPDRFALLLEQVDDRRAEQPEGVGGDGLLQSLQALRPAKRAQFDRDFHRGVEARQVQAGEVDEQELLRQHEVFLDQPITEERARVVVEQRVLFLEPDRLQGGGGQAQRRHLRGVVGRAQGDAGGGVEQQFVQRVDQRAFAVQVQAQALDRQLRQRQLRGRLDAQSQRGDGIGAGDRECGALGRFQARIGDADRPDLDRIAGAVADRQALHRAGQQLAVPRQLLHRADFGAGRELQLGDRHRRHRPQEVRVEHRQHRLGDLREFVVELLVDTCGEERERLDQPLDVRVLADLAFHLQPRGDLRILRGELLRQASQVGEFVLVIRQQLVEHGDPAAWIRARAVRDR
jgi:hypothetical protein